MNHRANIFAALIVIAVMTVAASCSDLETYSEIPRVEFQKVFLADTIDNKDLGNKVKLQEITLQVIDGDGNLGLNRDDHDTLRNLFITVFKKENGQYTRTADTTYTYRIPYKQPIGQNKYLRAEVIVSMTTPMLYVKYDTVRYEIYVQDRDENLSNTVTTCDIPIRENGVVWADGRLEE